ncbi:MAG: thiaminase II/PqqC family protein [Candidatus Deferrimicrobiaceae bacterium]|jgi:pyrroloquinoline quinone (PQQ) biosynthesis protein C
MAHQARQLLEDARKAIASTEERIRRHPYLEALEARGVKKGKLALFAGQQCHIIESDLRSVALIVSRAESWRARDFLNGMLQGERAALTALGSFGQAVGLSPEQLHAAEPLPGAFAYSAYVTWLATYGTAAEFVGAFLVNLPAWGGNCGRISRALQAGYGLSGQDVAFFDLFASAPPGFEEQGLAVVEEGLQQGADPVRIRRAARLLQGFELLYWDTMGEAAKG